MCGSDNDVSRRTVFKTVLGVATGTLVGEQLWFAFPAAAAVAAPTIVGCSTWGAKLPTEPITVLGARPTMVIVHHTATPNSTDLGQAHAYQLARSIQQSHFSRDFIDTGQQFTISRGGYVLEGRHRSVDVVRGGTSHVRGAHCEHQNDVAVGIENEGTYTTIQPPQVLYNKLVTLCAYICQQYRIPASEIYGHRDFNATTCPGDRLYALLPQIRAAVAAQLGIGRVWPMVQRGQLGERVKTVQYLLNYRGASLTVDGNFGPATESAVQSFQSAQGITADGIVRTSTWEALIITARTGDRGPATSAAQSQLASKGYTVMVDGIFGSGTQRAVKQFQTANGLTVDGVVGPQTWNTLVQ